MIKHFYGDILKSRADFICQQTNCQGKMGAGLAYQIKTSYPEVYSKYNSLCSSTTPDKLLGNVQAVASNCNGPIIVNMFAQNEYGTNKQYTDYEAFKNCLYKLRNITTKDSIIAFPYKIGCGLGGGNWLVIYEMIKEILNDREVHIYELI